MPQRDISDLIARKTNQVRYLDHSRLRAAHGLGVGLTYREFVDVVKGGILEFDSSGLVVGVDTRPIVVTISSDTYSITTSQTAVITFSFSQPVASFGLSDLIVANGTLSALIKVSDIIYTSTFTPTAAGNASVTVPVGSVSTVEGISNDVAAGVNIGVSAPLRLIPTITVSPTTITNIQTGNVHISFNIPINTGTFSDSDLAVIGGTVGFFSFLGNTDIYFLFTPASGYVGPAGILLDANRVVSLDGSLFNIAASTSFSITAP